MCDPVSVAVVGATGLAVGDEFIANDERRKQNKLKEEAADLHRRVFDNKVEAVGKEFRGKRIQASEAKQQRSIEAMRARALSQTSASASGVTGLSVDAVLDDFTRQEGVGNSSIDHSLNLQASSTNTALRGLALGTEGQLFNLRKEAFNPLAAALRIGKSAFGAFTGAGGFSGGKDDPTPDPTPSASNPVATNTGQTFGPTRSDFGYSNEFNNPGGRFL
jgi:hypothetical protein